MKKIKTKRLVMLAAALVAVLVISVVADYFYHQNRIYAGVEIDGIDLGGAKVEEARQLLEERFAGSRFNNTVVHLEFEEEIWQVTLGDLGVRSNLDLLVQEALAAGRDGLHFFHYPGRIALMRSPLELFPDFTVDREKFLASITEIEEALRIDPENGSLKLSSDRKKVEIIPDIPGRELDTEETLARLEASITGYPEIYPVQIAGRVVEAEWTAARLETLSIREPIATFSTTFSSTDANRNHNIALAAKAIDKTLLLPDQQFSFNEIVGNTTAEKGYKKAPVIVSGKLEEGLGGGICQVSSTLYNAVLLADLGIVERRNHGLVVGYLPPGRDATIAYGWIDLKFLNDRNHGVWVRTFIDGNRITVTLYGDPIPGHEVSVLTRDLTTIHADEIITHTAELPKGTREQVKRGQPGYRVTVWRVTTIDGEEIRRERISQDTYRAVPAEYRVGTAEIPATTEEKKKPKEETPSEEISDDEQDNPQEEENENNG